MRTIIATDKAPAAIGPYAQGNRLGNLIITSGQLPIDMETGAMPQGIEAQTECSLKNVQAILEAGGSSMDKVIKTTVFLKDMGDFGGHERRIRPLFLGRGVSLPERGGGSAAAQGCPGGN